MRTSNLNGGGGGGGLWKLKVTVSHSICQTSRPPSVNTPSSELSSPSAAASGGPLVRAQFSARSPLPRPWGASGGGGARRGCWLSSSGKREVNMRLYRTSPTAPLSSNTSTSTTSSAAKSSPLPPICSTWWAGCRRTGTGAGGGPGALEREAVRKREASALPVSVPPLRRHPKKSLPAEGAASWGRKSFEFVPAKVWGTVELGELNEGGEQVSQENKPPFFSGASI